MKALRSRFGRSVGLLAGLALTLAACASVDVPESAPGPTTTTTTEAQPVEQPECGDPTLSLRPDDEAGLDVAPGSYMAEIQARGRLRVGVDVATMLFSSINPETGEFQGFDVDIAKEVARALFGNPDAIQFVGIPSSERVNVLVEGESDVQVDLVADAFTVNCAREEDIDFSTVYFEAHQKFLVRKDVADSFFEDLGEREVCVSAGATGITNIQENLDPQPVLVVAAERGQCLVLLQQGEVDAVTSDDSILAGMAAQDPSLQVVGDEDLSDEPYGLGLPPDRPEWVRYVNAVLEDVREDRWGELYDEWLDEHLDPDQLSATPPAAPQPGYEG